MDLMTVQASRLVTSFLAVSPMYSWYTQRYRHTHSDRIGLFGSCPRPCYEISLGKQQGPWTGPRDRNRERKRERGRLQSPDKIPLFICPDSLLPSPLSIHPFLHHLPFLFYFSRNRQKNPVKAYQVKVACQSLWNQALHVRSGNPCNVWNKLAVHAIICVPDLQKVKRSTVQYEREWAKLWIKKNTKKTAPILHYLLHHTFVPATLRLSGNERKERENEREK